MKCFQKRACILHAVLNFASITSSKLAFGANLAVRARHGFGFIRIIGSFSK